MTSLVKAGLVAKTWNEGAVQGHRHALGRRLRRAQGQPEEHPHLGRPDQAGRGRRDAEPSDLRRRQVERDGRLRRAARRSASPTPKSVKYLGKLYDHVVSQDKSAREALQTFLAGRGDVLLSYENEAIFAQKHNQPLDYVIPKATIQIANPIAVVKTSNNKTAARAFVNFLRSKPAQVIFGENGYRPVLPPAAKRFQLPASAARVLDPVARRLGEGRQAVLRPEHRDRDQDPAEEGRLAERSRRELCPRGRGAARAPRPRARAWGSRPPT